MQREKQKMKGVAEEKSKFFLSLYRKNEKRREVICGKSVNSVDKYRCSKKVVIDCCIMGVSYQTILPSGSPKGICIV